MSDFKFPLTAEELINMKEDFMDRLLITVNLMKENVPSNRIMVGLGNSEAGMHYNTRSHILYVYSAGELIIQALDKGLILTAVKFPTGKNVTYYMFLGEIIRRFNYVFAGLRGLRKLKLVV